MFDRKIGNGRECAPRKILVTDVPKNTNRRRKFHSNVRGTSIGCKLLAWSANTWRDIRANERQMSVQAPVQRR